MLQKEYFKMQNYKLPHFRYSKPKIDIQIKYEDMRPRAKTNTHYKKAKLRNIDITRQDIYEFFNKAPGLRTEQEIELYGKYLSLNYEYFKKVKEEDSQLKVEKLAKVCRLEKSFKGESIINYGEVGNKFYVVLEGTVEIFKPKYVERELLPNEFLFLLNRIKEIEGNSLKYERIKEKNLKFFETYSEQGIPKEINSKNSQNSNSSKKSESKHSSSSRSDMDKLVYKQVFLMEEEEKMGEYGEGFSFGDIALIKQTVRNATIKAKENCILLTIGKNDYNNAILEFQSKKLNKEIDDFLKTFSFFKDFSHDKIINLFNSFSKKTIYKGEYLYEQNKNDKCIYIINNGTFLISCHLSFCWISDYINYIQYEEKNILEYLIQNKKTRYTDFIKIIKNCYNKLAENSLPTKYDKYDLWELVVEQKRKDNLYKIKKDEEKLNDPENIFNINIKKINCEEILGLEEVFDFKKRYCSCKCLSDKAEIKYITIYEFLKLIINLGEDELKYLLTIVNERKTLLKNQIIKSIENEEKRIITNFDLRYENLYKEAEDKKKNKDDKKNQMFSSLKIKGIKNSLCDVLDNNIPLLEFDKSRENPKSCLKIKKIKKNKSAEILLKSLYSNRKNNNKVKLKIIKNVLNKKIMSSKNRENIHILNIQNSLGTSKYPIHKKTNYTRNTRNYINISNTGESFFVNFKKRKSSNYSMDKNPKTTKFSFEKSQSKINFEISKTIDDSPNIKNIKEINKLNKFQNFTIHAEIDEHQKNQNIDAYGTINLPNLFEKKKKERIDNDFKSRLKKDLNKYKNFFHFNDKDKNFLVGTEFHKPLINGSYSFKNKNLSEIYTSSIFYFFKKNK